jgi:ApaG protein
MLETSLQSKVGVSGACTEGVRVLVRPTYLPQQSRPELGSYMWAYRIRITNESDLGVKLLSRKWLIIDADGCRKEVESEGVVGQQPELDPGESYEYTSHVPLETSWGTMEGSYTMVDANGRTFLANVPRFVLTPKALPTKAATKASMTKPDEQA